MHPALPRRRHEPALKTRLQTETVSGIAYVFECLIDMEDAIRALAVSTTVKGSTAELKEVCPHFGVIWPGGRALAAHVADEIGPGLKGLRVLELGCGLALPSLVAAKLGAGVVASDRHPLVREFLARNAAANGVAGLVAYEDFDWRSCVLDLAPFDLVMASDVLYDASQPVTLAAVLPLLVAPQGRILIADPDRGHRERFRALMEAQGFKAKIHERPTPNGRDVQHVQVIELTPA